jgi:hypothetical protein
MATRAKHGALLSRRNGKLRQLRDTHGSNPMHGGTDHHFAGFQVHMPRFAPATEKNVQSLAYLAGDLFKDRGSRFFPSGVHASLSDCSGRCTQIFSLIAINSALSFWKRWYSSISACAFRQAEGEGNDSATVFPSTLRVRRI